MSEKLLSIIIPSYNMEEYLDRCISSLIVEDESLLTKLDIIIVNDGSKDRTSEIAHDYEAKHPDVICVIDKPNGHYGSCINAGLKIAGGTYVKVLDADDWFKTACFQEFLKNIASLENESHPDLILNDFELVDANRNANFGITLPFDSAAGIQNMEALWHLNFPLHMPSVTYRTAIVKELGYRQSEGIPYTDNEWILYPLVKAKTFMYVAQEVYRYYVGREGQSMSKASFSAQSYAAKKVLIASGLERLESGVYDDVEQSRIAKMIISWITSIYMFIILTAPFNEKNLMLKEVDDWLRNFSLQYYNRTENIRYPNHGPWHFNILARLRKEHTLPYWYVISICVTARIIRGINLLKRFVFSLFINSDVKKRKYSED